MNLVSNIIVVVFVCTKIIINIIINIAINIKGSIIITILIITLINNNTIITFDGEQTERAKKRLGPPYVSLRVSPQCNLCCEKYDVVVGRTELKALCMYM